METSKRGEGTEGYSEALRELEFTSAFRAEMSDYLLMTMQQHDNVRDDELKEYLDNIQFHFHDALTYHGPIYEEGDATEYDEEPKPLAQVKTYESAMQYATISVPPPSIDLGISMSPETLNEIFAFTIQRCSLIRTAFQIISEGTSHEELAMKALEYGSFEDIMEGGVNEDATWSIRLRRYGPMEEDEMDDGKTSSKKKKANKRHARYGKNVRSPLRDERKAIMSMKDLVNLFRGKVDLANPECRIYLLEGLKQNAVAPSDDAGDTVKSTMLLARVVAQGPKVCLILPVHHQNF